MQEANARRERPTWSGPPSPSPIPRASDGRGEDDKCGWMRCVGYASSAASFFCHAPLMTRTRAASRRSAREDGIGAWARHNSTRRGAAREQRTASQRLIKHAPLRCAHTIATAGSCGAPTRRNEELWAPHRGPRAGARARVPVGGPRWKQRGLDHLDSRTRPSNTTPSRGPEPASASDRRAGQVLPADETA